MDPCSISPIHNRHTNSSRSLFEILNNDGKQNRKPSRNVNQTGWTFNKQQQKPIGQTILADQNMDRLGLDVADEAAMFTQQVVVSKHEKPHAILSQTAKQKGRLRSDQQINALMKSTQQDKMVDRSFSQSAIGASMGDTDTIDI